MPRVHVQSRKLNRVNSSTYNDPRQHLAEGSKWQAEPQTVTHRVTFTPAQQLFIHEGNIRDYRNSRISYPNILFITWCAGPLDELVLDKFPNLMHLCCDGNGLRTLQGIEGLLNLEILLCRRNFLRNLDPLRYLQKLRIVLCDDNEIETLLGLDHCIHLEILHCPHNRITNLCGLEHSRLRELCCSHNLLTNLINIDGCPRLERFDCSYNQITSLEHAIYLQRLIEFKCRGNPTSIISTRLCRFAAVIAQRKLEPIDPTTPRVIVVKPAVDFLCELLLRPVPEVTAEMINNCDLINTSTKKLLIEYNKDVTVHYQHLVMFSEISCYLWHKCLCKNPGSNKLFELEQFIDGIAKLDPEKRIEFLITYLSCFGDREAYLTSEFSSSVKISASHRSHRDPKPKSRFSRRFSIKTLLPKSKN